MPTWTSNCHLHRTVNVKMAGFSLSMEIVSCFPPMPNLKVMEWGGGGGGEQHTSISFAQKLLTVWKVL